METFSIFLSFLMPLGMLALVAFAIAAVMEGKNNMKKAGIIRSLYFYLASFITLAIVVGAVVYLANMGLKSWVFTQADSGPSSRLGPPPTLYISDSEGSVEATKDVMVLGSKLSCADTCSLTESQKTSIATWQASYQSWITAVENPGSQRARDAVVALSFLIVALPFYLIHFRIVQREAAAQADPEHAVIRPTYFYFASLAALIMMVVAGGFLINLGLKTWVFPSAGEADKVLQTSVAPVTAGAEGESVRSLVDCGAKCGLDQATVDLAGRWASDYDAWQKEFSQSSNNTQRQAASAIPFVLVGIPLFWYHWKVVRRESADKKEAKPEPPAS